VVDDEQERPVGDELAGAGAGALMAAITTVVVAASVTFSSMAMKPACGTTAHLWDRAGR
jgi:hypothetical protein